MREREAYLKSLNDLSHIAGPGHEDPLSLSHLKPSFVNASLQNSAMRRPGGAGLVNSGYGR